ncbi:AlpA family phage regulatory protein [Oxalobacteraceae bacterium OTU3CAMAD1]|nr:AlpA family phage regulatory protein [Oxalobacteraceae bacterium OTU3CAMAD1]
MNTYRSNTKPATAASTSEPDAQADVQLELHQIIQQIRARTSDSILRHSQLKGKCGRANSTIHADIVKGVFPPGFSIGVRATGYSANEIDAWIAAHLFASRSKTPVDMKAFVTLLVQSREQVSAQGSAA